MTRDQHILRPFHSENILGTNVHSIPLGDLIEHILTLCKEKRKGTIAYVNVHAINLACYSPRFRKFLNTCEIVFCDGFGVKWAGWFLHKVILHRYTPPDWFPILAQRCAQQGLTMYFIGAKPGVAQKAADILTARAPGLAIIGVHDGYFDRSAQSTEQKALIEDINRLKPDILVVGLGMPIQEEWIEAHLPDLAVHIALPVGAFFDYAAGETIRAPRWMTDHGLEWLGRLVIEPGRLWKRYILGNPIFLWRVLLQKFGLFKSTNKP